MARIGLTLSGIERRLLSNLAAANAEIALSSYRTATGHRINAAGDDPAGFVYLSGLQSQLGNVTAALSNMTAAGSVVSQVQSGISAVQTRLETIRDLLLEGETVTEMVDQVNMHRHETGVTAAPDDADTMTLASVDYGSSTAIQLQDPGSLFTVDSETAGTNASAVINGRTIEADSPLVSGNRFTYSDNGFQFNSARSSHRRRQRRE